MTTALENRLTLVQNAIERILLTGLSVELDIQGMKRRFTQANLSELQRYESYLEGKLKRQTAGGVIINPVVYSDNA